MELTMVSRDSGDDFTPGVIDGLRARLTDRRLTALIAEAGPDDEVSALAFAALLGLTPTIRTHVDLDAVIVDNPGGDVLVLCAPTSIRDLVADVLDVDREYLPIPVPASITRIRASRRGIRGLISLNDTLHLPIAGGTARDRSRKDLTKHE